jgi:hypothetical protein
MLQWQYDHSPPIHCPYNSRRTAAVLPNFLTAGQQPWPWVQALAQQPAQQEARAAELLLQLAEEPSANPAAALPQLLLLPPLHLYLPTPHLLLMLPLAPAFAEMLHAVCYCCCCQRAAWDTAAAAGSCR